MDSLAPQERYIRPSNVSTLAACPGAARMAAAVVERWGEPPEPPEATGGTTVHAHVAAWVRAWKRVGSDFSQEDTGLEPLTGWDQQAVRNCYGFFLAMVERHGIEPENVLIEHRLDMESVGIQRGGTADIVLVVPFQRVIVIDWKAGYLDQGDAEDHEQTHSYAMAAAVTIRCETAEAWVYSPRLPEPARATGCTLDAEAVRANAEWTRQICDGARAENPPLHAGHDQCIYCDALVQCPQCKGWYMNVLEAIKEIGDPESPEEWAELTGAAKVAKKAAKVGEEMAKAHAHAGHEIPGYALRSTGSVTKIDPAAAVELAGEDIDRLRQLLGHATIKAAAAHEIDWIAEIVDRVPKAQALVRAKR